MQGMIPTRVLRELNRGSHESVVMETARAVEAAHAKFGAKRPGDVHLLSTFSEHAIVVTESGDAFRVHLKALNDGSRTVLQTEEVEVPIISTVEDQLAFAGSAAGGIVEAVRSGDFDSARTRIQELVEAADLIAPPDPVTEAREYLGSLFDRERPWRRIYAENQERIHRFLWGASGVTPRDVPKQNYAELCGEGVDNPESYHGAVSSDLGLLEERLAKLWERIEGAYSRYQENHVAGGFQPVQIAGINEGFETFTSDFVEELRAVHALIEQAARDEDERTVKARAAIHDFVAREYPIIEVAARLIQRGAADLAAK